MDQNEIVAIQIDAELHNGQPAGVVLTAAGRKYWCRHEDIRSGKLRMGDVLDLSKYEEKTP